MIALGVDAGASSTRWALADAAGVIARGTAPALTGHAFGAEARAEARAALAALAADVRATGAPARACAGVTGLSGDGAVTAQYRDWLAAVLGLAPAAVRVVSDMEIAYRAAFAPGAGILVYAGTGAIAWHLRADGGSERAGGHGFMIDDAGGGFWIGRRALRAVLRARDEGRPPGVLDRALSAACGGAAWEAVRAHVYGGGRRAVAALVPAVAAAARDGDADAREILAVAGQELARLGRVLLDRVGKKPVALAGGAVAVGAALTDAFAQALPEVETRVLDLDAAASAAAFALEMQPA